MRDTFASVIILCWRRSRVRQARHVLERHDLLLMRLFSPVACNTGGVMDMLCVFFTRRSPTVHAPRFTRISCSCRFLRERDIKIFE